MRQLSKREMEMVSGGKGGGGKGSGGKGSGSSGGSGGGTSGSGSITVCKDISKTQEICVTVEIKDK